MLTKEKIKAGLESGTMHPIPLLQAFHRDGDAELLRYVAEIGGEYLQGKERFGFRTTVARLVPEVHSEREQASSKHAQKKREEHTSALEKAFRDRSIDLKERAKNQPPLPIVCIWQRPPRQGS